MFLRLFVLSFLTQDRPVWSVRFRAPGSRSEQPHPNRGKRQPRRPGQPPKPPASSPPGRAPAVPGDQPKGPVLRWPAARSPPSPGRAGRCGYCRAGNRRRPERPRSGVRAPDTSPRSRSDRCCRLCRC